MTHWDVKQSLAKCKKKQRDLLAEVKKRGYTTINESLLSKILNDAYPTKTGTFAGVMETIETILHEWETK